MTRREIGGLEVGAAAPVTRPSPPAVPAAPAGAPAAPAGPAAAPAAPNRPFRIPSQPRGADAPSSPALPLPVRRGATPDAGGGQPSPARQPAGAVEGGAPPAPVPAVEGVADVLRQRSALASEALTELSRLSAYSPAAVDTKPPATLTRRTPASTPAAQVAAPRPAPANRRTRDAADVRSMLSGFQAGVERGRTSPTDQSDTTARPTGGQA